MDIEKSDHFLKFLGLELKDLLRLKQKAEFERKQDEFFHIVYKVPRISCFGIKFEFHDKKTVEVEKIPYTKEELEKLAMAAMVMIGDRKFNENV